jgi:transcriptional regulator with XRE-family HTH domain
MDCSALEKIESLQLVNLNPMLAPEVLPQVAKKIKSIRTKKNLTLLEVSKNSNVSKGLLSKIENSRTIPSLPVFLGIVNALGVNFKDFFDDIDLMQGKEYLLIRDADQHFTQKEGREGFIYKSVLAQNIHSHSIDVVILQVMPGARSTLTTTDGFELKYILKGQCDYYINEQIIHLREGDTLYFDASKPHMPVNRGTDPVVMLVVYFLN